MDQAPKHRSTMTIRTSLLAALLGFTAIACDVPLQDVYELRSKTSVPKGLAYDPIPQVFYATSLRGGEITMITALGREYSFYEADEPNVAFHAAVVDAERRTLWVCAVEAADPSLPRASLLGFDLDEGRLERRVELSELWSAPSPTGCQALDVDAGGAVYVADRVRPAIYRHDPATNKSGLLANTPELAGPGGEGSGISGLALHPDGEHLVVALADPPALRVLTLEEPDELGVVDFPQRPLGRAGDPRMSAAQGIAFVGDELFVVFPGAVQRVRFTDPDRLRTARVHTATALPNGLSSATAADGVAYAIDSDAFQVEALGVRPEPPFAIVRVDPVLFTADEDREEE